MQFMIEFPKHKWLDDLTGVVIWQKLTSGTTRVIVWCMDAGRLAFCDATVERLPAGWTPATGDLVQVQCRRDGEFRRCVRIELVEPTYDAALPDRLLKYSRRAEQRATGSER